MPIPAALLIDDSAPVNMMVYHEPWHPHTLLIPNAVVRQFARICSDRGVKGKFTVLPMPAGLGRIDKGLNGVPASHLRTFLDITRERIAPHFDISCELLTHLIAYDVSNGYFKHMWEDVWVAGATAEEIADYIAAGLRVLDAVGLCPTGATSPWDTGGSNEQAYAEGIARAFWNVLRRKTSWYFRDMSIEGPGKRPTVVWQDRNRGLKTVSVCANTNDAFWDVQEGSARTARTAARAGADTWLTANGKSGRVRELFDQGAPITLLTHWQCMFANGRDAGLYGLELVLDRICNHFGSDIQWMRCSEIAKLAR
jgi:hypothetical protein